MSFKKLLFKNDKSTASAASPPAAKPAQEKELNHPQWERDDQYYELKRKIHGQLVEELNLMVLEKLDVAEIIPEISQTISQFLARENALMNESERQQFILEIVNEIKGLGPLEPFLQDASVSDILCNTYMNIYVERFGLLEKTKSRFLNDAHMMNIIDRIVSRVGRRVDESTPMVDARLPDGSRVNAIIPPLAIDGPILSIRRFAVNPLKTEDLIRNEALTRDIAEFLAGCVQAKLNILISGGTGAGKTTLLNVLSSHIPHSDRIVTIEDAAELQLQQNHVVRLETRPPNIEQTGEVTPRDLVRNSLRMRPDRIIVGEVRGAEAFDMLQAMNTGHEGSLTTIHANSPRDSLTRLESMMLMTGINLPNNSMRFMMSSALDLIVQVSRLADGTRKITSISEVTGMEGDIITLQDIFVFQKKGIDPSGKVLGRFTATGIRPKFSEKMEIAGVKVPYDYFISERCGE